ncbi:MAG TPA: hypothetical protein VFZ61_12015 [Polyangiales bacterium]
MTRGLTHALCRLLALLACVMCSQSASRAMATPSIQAGVLGQLASTNVSLRPDASETELLSSQRSGAGHQADDTPASEPPCEERESDDDPDQDDDFDDAQPFGLRSTSWDTPPLVAAFGATLLADPTCSNHRLLDPRPPRRC